MLSALAALAILVLLRSFYLELSGQRQFSTPLSIALHYGVPSAAAAVAFAARWLVPLARLRLLLAVVSATAAVYGAEILLVATADSGLRRTAMSTIFVSEDRLARAAALGRRFGTAVDARLPAEVLTELRQLYGNAVRVFTPGNNVLEKQPDGAVTSRVRLDGMEVLPLAGPSRVVTLACNETGTWMHYLSDERGFNNPPGAWEPKGRLQVAIVGDSFAHGYCADENLAHLVRERYSVLNLGMAGSGPLLMLATLSQYLPALEPRVVLWLYYEGNDLTDLQTERQSDLLTRYLTDGFRQSALDRQGEIDKALLAELAEDPPRPPALSPWIVRYYALTGIAKVSTLRARLGLAPLTEPVEIARAEDFDGVNLDVLRTVIRKAHARVQSWNGQLVFVYLPEWARSANTVLSTSGAKRVEVLRIVREEGLPLLDMAPRFERTGDPLSLFPFREPGHYTSAGHRVVAEELLRGLPTWLDVAGATPVPEPRLSKDGGEGATF